MLKDQSIKGWIVAAGNENRMIPSSKAETLDHIK